jgi:hypothetical protein
MTFSYLSPLSKKPAETDLVPALVVQSNDLQAGVHAIGMGAIALPRRLLRRGAGTPVPELLDRVVMDGVAEGEEQAAGQLAVMKAGVERFEPINLIAPPAQRPGLLLPASMILRYAPAATSLRIADYAAIPARTAASSLSNPWTKPHSSLHSSLLHLCDPGIKLVASTRTDHAAKG